MNLIFNLVYTLKVILVNPHEQQKIFYRSINDLISHKYQETNLV